MKFTDLCLKIMILLGQSTYDKAEPENRQRHLMRLIKPGVSQKNKKKKVAT